MKKAISALLFLALCLGLAGCGRSPIQKATGANDEQATRIEDYLEGSGIAYETIEKAPETDAAEDYAAFTLTDREGRGYTLLLTPKNLAVVSVTDNETGEKFFPNLTYCVSCD